MAFRMPFCVVVVVGTSDRNLIPGYFLNYLQIDSITSKSSPFTLHYFPHWPSLTYIHTYTHPSIAWLLLVSHLVFYWAFCIKSKDFFSQMVMSIFHAECDMRIVFSLAWTTFLFTLMLSFQGICKPLQKWNQRQQLNSKATPISISISTKCHEDELRESKHSRRRRRWKKKHKPSRMIAKRQMDFPNVYGKTRKMNGATQYFNILFSIFCVEWMKWKQQSVSNKMWKCNDGRRKCTDAKHNKNEWEIKWWSWRTGIFQHGIANNIRI